MWKSRLAIQLVCLSALLLSPALHGDESLAGIACRSVHLQYKAPQGLAFYNEVTVEKSAPGTYFCVCGFSHGYYGLQELANGKKVLIFSIWDPGRQDDPKAVKDEVRVKLLYKDPAVRTGRFGGEGTGGQSFLDFDWKAGESYRFLVTARPDDKRTEFTAWFFPPDEKAWRKLVTFSTLTGGKPLAGYYSFVEDFRRNRASTEHARQARFGNGFVRGEEGSWLAIAEARFTADSNPAKTINAGPIEGRFFLATGGDTKNDGTPLGKQIELPGDDLPKVPGDLPEM